MQFLSETHVADLRAGQLVPYYLIHSYLYYIDNTPCMSDSAYDQLCHRVDAEWEIIEHPHRDVIDRASLSATTGFTLKETDYPRMVVGAARHLARLAWEDNLYETLAPHTRKVSRVIRRSRPVALVAEPVRKSRLIRRSKS